MIAEALREAASALAAQGTGTTREEARLEAERMMAAALGASRSQLLLHRMRDAVPASFPVMLARRLAGEPLAHVLGRQQFYGLDFAVTNDVLIPRADSEVLIDAAREALAARPPARVLDCGTGSGALLCAALHFWSEARGIGIDRSPEALEIARHNVGQLGLRGRAEMVVADWTRSGWAEPLLFDGRFDLVLTNPPYVAEADPDLSEEVRAYEPAGALFAGTDGLDAYRALLPQLSMLMTKEGVALVEIGSRQAAAASALAMRCGLEAVLHCDLAGRPRALAITKPAGSG